MCFAEAQQQSFDSGMVRQPMYIYVHSLFKAEGWITKQPLNSKLAAQVKKIWQDYELRTKTQYTQSSVDRWSTGHPSPKVLGKYYFYQPTGLQSSCSWLLLSPCLRELRANPEDCEVISLCRRRPVPRKWSGVPPRPPPGGHSLRGLRPLPIPTSLFHTS